MKLIDLLARDLKAWPNDFYDEPSLAVTQDRDRTVNCFDGNEEVKPHESQFLDHGDWNRCYWSGGVLETGILASDHATAIVTREQWKEAVAALACTPESIWNGEGRPVAGAKLEWKELTGFQWVAATVLFISDSSIVLQRSDGFEWQMLASSVVFRPIATPEQIAEDQKRNAAIEEMVSLAPMLDKGWARKVCIAIYDAGYRKPE